mmetsp:Transcript_58889/g.131721  ORF Transcript_58889/g.131721 Transcript_58889/m.131721 type:complete len:269 (+) Transcript_58889:826-1632(+)
MRKLVQLQVLVSAQPKNTARGSNQDVWRAVLEHFNILCNGCATIDNASFHTLEVLRETIKLVLDLVCQLACVANDQDFHSLVISTNLLKGGQDENRCLTHARLSLAQDIGSQDRLWDAFVLDLRRVLKSAINNGSKQVLLQQEVFEACSMNSSKALSLVVGSVLLLLLLLSLLIIEVWELLGCLFLSCGCGHYVAKGRAAGREGSVCCPARLHFTRATSMKGIHHFSGCLGLQVDKGVDHQTAQELRARTVTSFDRCRSSYSSWYVAC